MSHSGMMRSRGTRRDRAMRRRMTMVGLATILSLVMSLFPQVVRGAQPPTAGAHNLQTKMVYMFLDPNTQAFLDARIARTLLEAPPCAGPPNPLLRVNDELGIIIKVVPRDGTTTGVGGHVDFYVPNGVTVVDAAYWCPATPTRATASAATAKCR